MPRRLTTYVLLTLLAIGAIAGFVWLRNGEGDPPPLDTEPFVFDGTSDQLNSTVIVPTFDTPTNPGKNVVWCSSFPLAWKKLEQNVTRGTVRLDGAQAFADRLHTDPSAESDLPPNAVYVNAGFNEDGIADRIRTDMAVRFPQRKVPAFNLPPGGALAYCYFEVSTRFPYPYFEYDEPQAFTHADGSISKVRAFGIRSKEAFAYNQLRGQVNVLYLQVTDRGQLGREFAVDINATSRDQVILAVTDRKPTLAEQWADLSAKIAAQKAGGGHTGVMPNDTLLVPNIGFRVEHRFRELEVGPVAQASQMIQFRLNRNGADLASESAVHLKPTPMHYHCDRPFQVVMKRRDRERPYFLAWIDNAELLEK
ncbi:MAG: hypothetical protein MUF18_13990 [Fimbriiglobus sp.]|nr:hypothetical protein [Fimbriiglobus sp.]